jgi:hypothetical protein
VVVGVDDGDRLVTLIVGGADLSRGAQDLYAGWRQLISTYRDPDPNAARVLTMPRPPFTSPGDFNGQLQQFLAPREHPAPSGARVLWSRRADRIDADSGHDPAAAAGATDDRPAQLDLAAARSLHPVGLQRLFGASR